MMPAIYDFTWVRGTTDPLKIKFERNGVPIAIDDARLTVNKGPALAFRMSTANNSGETAGATFDAETGEATFTPTAAQTRMLIATKPGELGKNSYEIELREGELERVYVMGTIAAIGGLNDDVDG